MKTLVEYIKRRFRKHNYVPFAKSATYGLWYKCGKCGDETYIPYDWLFRVRMENRKGCKGHE